MNVLTVFSSQAYLCDNTVFFLFVHVAGTLELGSLFAPLLYSL
jgi:hypothetical protein